MLPMERVSLMQMIDSGCDPENRANTGVLSHVLRGLCGAAVPMMFAVDVIRGVCGTIFLSQRGAYFKNLLIIAPIQYSAFSLSALAFSSSIAVLVLKICAIAIPALIITPKLILGVAALTFLCLPVIYRASKAFAEEFSSHDFSIFDRGWKRTAVGIILDPSGGLPKICRSYSLEDRNMYADGELINQQVNFSNNLQDLPKNVYIDIGPFYIVGSENLFDTESYRRMDDLAKKKFAY